LTLRALAITSSVKMISHITDHTSLGHSQLNRKEHLHLYYRKPQQILNVINNICVCLTWRMSNDSAIPMSQFDFVFFATIFGLECINCPL